MYNILVTPNTLYSFLLHPISNKIPSPKELVYPDELFYFSFIHAGCGVNDCLYRFSKLLVLLYYYTLYYTLFRVL